MVSIRFHAQGWFADPFGQHEARWFSDGSPTALVRDDGLGSMDPPPLSSYTGQLEPVAESEGELLHSHPDEGDDRERRMSAIRALLVLTGGD
jgi:hypothetical protein